MEKDRLIGEIRRIIAEMDESEANELITEIANAISRPTTKRVAGTFTIPGQPGRRKLAYRKQSRRAWSFRVMRRSVKTAVGTVATYGYWAAVRRKPHNYRQQEYVTVCNENEWEPTAEFRDAFNSIYSVRRSKPTRSEVKQFVHRYLNAPNGGGDVDDFDFGSMLDF